MDEQQAFRAIRNAIRLETLGRDVAAKVTPQLREAYKYLQDLIANLPEEAIGRELRYRQLADMIRATLEPVSQTALNETKEAIVEEIPHQLTYAEKILGEGDQLPLMQLTRTQLVEMATDTEVLGKRIDQLFGEGTFTRAQVTKVDKVVKQGFLLGETNQQIARNLATAFNGSRRDVTAVTRTAVMDMSQRAHNRFWDANSSRIKMWEFDATFDYRVCPECYPYDGKRSEDRDSLPSVPRHPNCRCRILPLTATALALEKEDLKNGVQVSTVQIGKPEHTAAGGGKPRVYKTKAKVDGRKVDKFAKEYTTPRGERPTMGFFLEKANDTTREAVLGKSKAKHFKSMLKNGISPEDALVTVTKNKGGSIPFKAKPVAKKRKPAVKTAAPKPKVELTPAKQLEAEGRELLNKAAPQLQANESIRRKARAVLKGRTDALVNATTPEAKAAAKAAYRRASSIVDRSEAKVEGAMGKVLEFMSETTMSKAEVKATLDRVNISGWGTSREVKKVLKQNMTDFIKMFNGSGFTATANGHSWVKVVEPALDGRGWNRMGHTVAARVGSRGNLFHELMHTVESQRPWMVDAAREWAAGRADTLEQANKLLKLRGMESSTRLGKPLYRLADIIPGSGYPTHEVAWNDDYLNPYMGKYYDNANSTEVWTMAVEMFGEGPKGMRALFSKHPELFRMVVGLSRRS